MSERSDLRVDTGPAGDLLGSLAFGSLALFAIVEAWRMPRFGTLGLLTGAGLTPLLAGGMVLALSLYLAGSSVKKGAHRLIGLWARSLVAQDEFRRWLVLVALTGGYVVLMGRIPFWLVNFAYLTAMFAYLRVGSVLRIGAYSALGTLLVAYAIPWVFRMPVP